MGVIGIVVGVTMGVIFMEVIVILMEVMEGGVSRSLSWEPLSWESLLLESLSKESLSRDSLGTVPQAQHDFCRFSCVQKPCNFLFKETADLFQPTPVALRVSRIC